ncbi:hypothetical protein [Larkinella humicola]|uniref:Uncharacterized protein n=1 Tax=Larkinella humicola TaxID=2607654 RepID=A0A5N1JFH5_9BACT|nr:hypothetical protein [Larkinella humicola]KAA9353016.1 hypothetical protein F0P93_17705 [Larkinella humicola]
MLESQQYTCQISELPLYHYTALLLPLKGYPLCQWDMYVAEDIGFAKCAPATQNRTRTLKSSKIRPLRLNRKYKPRQSLLKFPGNY